MTCLSRTKSELASPHRLMGSQDIFAGLCIYVSICGGVYLYLDWCVHSCIQIWKQMTQRVFRVADCPSQCHYIYPQTHTHIYTHTYIHTQTHTQAIIHKHLPRIDTLFRSIPVIIHCAVLLFHFQLSYLAASICRQCTSCHVFNKLLFWFTCVDPIKGQTFQPVCTTPYTHAECKQDYFSYSNPE